MPAMVVTLLVLVAGLLGACGSDPGKGTITLYSGQHEQTTQALIAAFEKQTGITVKVRFDDEDTFADQITTEGSRSPADVLYTENTPPLQELEDKGLLARLQTATLDQTPSRYNSAGGDWVGVSARVSVLIYNPSLIKRSELPTTALAMAEPRYRGKVAVAEGESDFYSVVTSMDHAYGQARTLEWLEGLKANAAGHVYPDNETIADEVNRGAVAFGVVNQYYWYRMEAELGKGAIHSAIAYFAPHDPGYVLDVSGAAVLKSSKHQADAQRFVAFLVSKAGQEVIAHSLSFEYPLDHGVAPGAAETPLADLEPNSITLGQLGTGSTAIALLRKAGLL